MEVQKMTKAYFVGGGIASLAGAVFLIRDGNVPGKNITILEESNPEANPIGGSLDGQGEANKGYVVRGGRMLNDETYECMWELLKSIPSLKDPKKSVRQEIAEFNAINKPHSLARLVNKDGQIVDVSSPGFSEIDRLDLIKMMAQTEKSLGTRSIEECFAPGFLKPTSGTCGVRHSHFNPGIARLNSNAIFTGSSMSSRVSIPWKVCAAPHIISMIHWSCPF